jgi:hemoglobin-like flavoprotein
MTREQVMLVQDSWERVVRMQDDAVDLFYRRLFDIDPGLRQLFTGDMHAHGRRMAGMVTLFVRDLDPAERAMPAIRALGRRHAGYDVRDEDYDVFGLALLSMVEQVLGSEFDDAVHEAWATAYALLTRSMQASTTAVAA